MIWVFIIAALILFAWQRFKPWLDERERRPFEIARANPKVVVSYFKFPDRRYVVADSNGILWTSKFGIHWINTEDGRKITNEDWRRQVNKMQAWR